MFRTLKTAQNAPDTKPMKKYGIVSVVNGTGIEALYKDVSSLYRLDGLSSGDEIAKPTLGPLPSTALILLSSICGAWVLIGAYVVVSHTKKRQK